MSARDLEKMWRDTENLFFPRPKKDVGSISESSYDRIRDEIRIECELNGVDAPTAESIAANAARKLKNIGVVI